MVVETRSRIDKGKIARSNPKSVEQGQKGKEKHLQIVLEESEKKQKLIKTIKIKQEVLEEANDPSTEQETQSEGRNTVIEIQDDEFNNEAEYVQTERETKSTSNNATTTNNKSISSTYSTSTKRRLTGTKFPKRRKPYYQDIREFAKVLDNTGSGQYDEQSDTQQQHEDKETDTSHTEKLKDLIKNFGLDTLQFEKGKPNKNNFISSQKKNKVDSKVTEKSKLGDKPNETNTTNELTADTRDTEVKRAPPLQKINNEAASLDGKTTQNNSKIHITESNDDTKRTYQKNESLQENKGHETKKYQATKNEDTNDDTEEIDLEDEPEFYEASEDEFLEKLGEMTMDTDESLEMTKQVLKENDNRTKENNMTTSEDKISIIPDNTVHTDPANGKKEQTKQPIPAEKSDHMDIEPIDIESQYTPDNRLTEQNEKNPKVRFSNDVKINTDSSLCRHGANYPQKNLRTTEYFKAE